jgi:hypothetical protein
MAGDSPLLAGEGETETPTLGAATRNNDTIDQSPLERLIAQSTSEQAAARSAAPFLLEEPQPPRVGVVHPQFLPDPNTTQPMSSMAASLATVSASSLCLLQMGLVWASFLSDSWFDTYLRVSVSWQDYLPSFNDDLDRLLNSTTLASLLSTFIGAEQHWASMGLLLSSLVIPCLAMILCPSWTVGDYNERFVYLPRTTGCWIPRVVFESVLRLSLLAFFILAILDMGISSIEIENNDTKMRITNRTRGGLVCYTLGMTCAIGVVVILRLASLGRPAAPRAEADTNHPSATPRAPPNRAFQLPWRNDDEDSRQLQRPLLEDNDEEALRRSMQVPSETTDYHGLSFFKKTIVFEVGLLSTVLWLPALFLELFEVHYEGLASTFMTELTFSIRFWEVPAVVWQRGVTAETKGWMLLALGTVLVSFAYVLPMLATILCIAAWRTKPSASRFCRNMLWLIHPCLCGITFALAMLLAIPAFGPIGDYLLEEETSGICKRFEEITDASCLRMDASPSLGLWFLFGQSVALEAFVLVTLGWDT